MTDELLAIAARIVESAQRTEQIDVMVSRGRSTTVKVFGGEVEAFTSAGSAGIGVRVIADGRVGFAHAGSLDPDVIADVVAQARDNVRFATRDEYVALAKPDGVEAVLHDHWNPAVLELSAEDRIARAIELERLTTSLDPRITGIRTASWSDGSGESAYASSMGVRLVDRGTSCGVGVQPLARSGEETQIGYAGDAQRDPNLIDLQDVAERAVERATRLLGAVKPPSDTVTLLIEPRLAASLIGIVVGMLDGESVAKGRTPFADRMGDQIASPLLSVTDDPTRTESLAADSWDGEGLACRPTELISGGTLRNFLHNSYTARRVGAWSTGSAVRGARSLPGVGARVLVMEPGQRSFEELVGSIDHGLFVASFAGLHSGVNPISGDFSVGADGLMIRNGSLAEPVREVTVASTLQRLLLDIAEVGGDAEWLPSGDYLASLVIPGVSMSGS